MSTRVISVFYLDGRYEAIIDLEGSALAKPPTLSTENKLSGTGITPEAAVANVLTELGRRALEQL